MRIRPLSVLLAAALAAAAPACAFAEESGTALSAPAGTRKPPEPGKETYQQLGKFANVFDQVRREYVDRIDDAKLIDLALKGMLAGLDPHSAYLPPEDFTQLSSETKGAFGGLGIEVEEKDGLIRIVAPMDGGPAEKAGLKANDLVVAVDGDPVRGKPLDQSVKRMRGEPGTKVKISVVDGDKPDSEPKIFELERAVISVPAVKSKMERGVAVLRLTRFSEKAGEQIAAEIKKLSANKPRGWILDMRNNPGGLLDQAVEVAGAFMEPGEIVSAKGRDGAVLASYSTSAHDLLSGAPLVVLINGGSASAAEIVAGALQDRKRAKLVGTSSFGKGSVQSVFGNKDGSAVKITTARYYTPSGRSIQGDGIVPDVEVHAAGQHEMAGGTEGRLPGALGKDSGKKAQAVAGPAVIDIGPGKDAPKDAPKDAAKPQEPKTDPQLDKAVEMLGGDPPAMPTAAP